MLLDSQVPPCGTHYRSPRIPHLPLSTLYRPFLLRVLCWGPLCSNRPGSYRRLRSSFFSRSAVMSPSVTSSSSSHHFTKPPRPPTVTANRPRRASSPSNPISRTSVLRQRAVTDTRPARSQLHAQRVQRDSEMSAFSSKEQLASSASDLSLRPSSRDTRSSGISQWTEERADGLARSFLTKSSKLLMKRRGSKVGLSSIRTLEWLEDTEDTTGSKHVQELSKRRKSKHSRDQSAGYGMMNVLP